MQQPQGEGPLRDWATLLYNAAWYAWTRGVVADAERMSMMSMKARKKLLGPEHSKSLSSMAMVGLAYQLGGRRAGGAGDGDEKEGVGRGAPRHGGQHI